MPLQQLQQKQMSPIDFLVLGDVTKDLTDGGYQVGGTAFYSAQMATKLGWRVGLVTSASSDIDLSSVLPGVDVLRIDSPVTTTFRNTYSASGRKQFVSAQAKRVELKHIPKDWLMAPVVHLGPVVHEIEPDLVLDFPASTVGVTAQGWLRRWDDAGRIYPTRWESADRYLAKITVLILSQEDVKPDPDIVSRAVENTQTVVITEGAGGARVYYCDRWHHLPSFAVEEKDPTGAGDVFAAAFLFRLAQYGYPVEAALFANCAASFIIEQEGRRIFPSLMQVEERLASLHVGSI